MLEELFFDLRSVDVLPRAANDVFNSADKVYVALLVHLCQVTGAKPAICEDGLYALCVSKVTHEEAVGILALQEQMARYIWWHRLSLASHDAGCVPFS